MPTFSLSERNTRLPYDCSHLNIEGRTLYYVDARQCATVAPIGPCYYCGHGGEVPGGRWVERHIVCEPCAVDHGAPRQCDLVTFHEAERQRDLPPLSAPPSLGGLYVPMGVPPMPRPRTAGDVGYKKAKALPLP
jgi:hypothetical protein